MVRFIEFRLAQMAGHHFYLRMQIHSFGSVFNAMHFIRIHGGEMNRETNEFLMYSDLVGLNWMQLQKTDYHLVCWSWLGFFRLFFLHDCIFWLTLMSQLCGCKMCVEILTKSIQIIEDQKSNIHYASWPLVQWMFIFEFLNLYVVWTIFSLHVMFCFSALKGYM